MASLEAALEAMLNEGPRGKERAAQGDQDEQNVEDDSMGDHQAAFCA
ncbi:MAG: hypothetical protein ACRYG8_01065 [Janthinobacterium lividum]